MLNAASLLFLRLVLTVQSNQRTGRLIMATTWGKGKTIDKAVKDIEQHSDIILNGVVLAIDPASRSLGFATFSSGVLQEKGTLLSKKGDINLRLQDLATQLQLKCKNVDLLAVEQIRGSHAHDYLKWSIGMAVSNVRAPRFVEVPIQFWKKVVGADYEKNDENDAEMIGKVLVIIAEEKVHGKNSQGTQRGRLVSEAEEREQEFKATGI
jgi:hypothetical protein